MKLVIVLKHNELTKKMQDFDVFENFKCIAKIACWNTLKPVTKQKMKKILKNKFDGDYQPVLVAFVQDGKKPKVVYDENYKIYSSGKKWCMRDDFIENLSTL